MTSDREEIDWHARHFDHLAALYAAEKGTEDATRWSRAAALIRRLERERDEARNKALDEAAEYIRDNCWCEPEKHAEAILALKG